MNPAPTRTRKATRPRITRTNGRKALRRPPMNRAVDAGAAGGLLARIGAQDIRPQRIKKRCQAEWQFRDFPLPLPDN